LARVFLSLAYYEAKEYDKALKCSQTAVELEPGCALVLWHYAGSLFTSNKGHLALPIWIRLLDMDVEDIAFGYHGEGMDRALQLVYDVHYKLARYYEWAGQPALTTRSLQKYIHDRKHGVHGIFSVDYAQADLARLDVG
jgi:hypothetical protein